MLNRSVLRAAPTVWSRRNLMAVLRTESLGSVFFFLEDFGLGWAGNVVSRKSCLEGVR